jgi:TetR/AcrR family transcriptional regulator, lmrAB and yxaGH operons repressor
VLKLTGAPRGSIYHHFPEGKDQLVGAALDLAAGRLFAALDQQAGASAEEVTAFVIRVWRGVLTLSEFGAGCAVLAVTVAADSPELRERAAAVFRAWRGRLAELLEQGGLSRRDATGFATTLIASTEGAVVLSRAEQSIEPFDQVADQLVDQVRRMTAAG